MEQVALRGENVLLKVLNALDDSVHVSSWCGCCRLKGAGDRRLGALATKWEVGRSKPARRVARPPAFLQPDTDSGQAQGNRPRCTEQGYVCFRSSSRMCHRAGLC